MHGATGAACKQQAAQDDPAGCPAGAPAAPASLALPHAKHRWRHNDAPGSAGSGGTTPLCTTTATAGGLPPHHRSSLGGAGVEACPTPASWHPTSPCTAAGPAAPPPASPRVAQLVTMLAAGLCSPDLLSQQLQQQQPSLGLRAAQQQPPPQQQQQHEPSACWVDNRQPGDMGPGGGGGGGGNLPQPQQQQHRHRRPSAGVVPGLSQRRADGAIAPHTAGNHWQQQLQQQADVQHDVPDWTFQGQVAHHDHPPLLDALAAFAPAAAVACDHSSYPQLPAELQTRLRKRVRIIQPISSSWEADVRQPLQPLQLLPAPQQQPALRGSSPPALPLPRPPQWPRSSDGSGSGSPSSPSGSGGGGGRRSRRTSAFTNMSGGSGGAGAAGSGQGDLLLQLHAAAAALLPAPPPSPPSRGFRPVAPACAPEPTFAAAHAPPEPWGGAGLPLYVHTSSNNLLDAGGYLPASAGRPPGTPGVAYSPHSTGGDLSGRRQSHLGQPPSGGSGGPLPFGCGAPVLHHAATAPAAMQFGDAAAAHTPRSPPSPSFPHHALAGAPGPPPACWLPPPHGFSGLPSSRTPHAGGLHPHLHQAWSAPPLVGGQAGQAAPPPLQHGVPPWKAPPPPPPRAAPSAKRARRSSGAAPPGAGDLGGGQGAGEEEEEEPQYCSAAERVPLHMVQSQLSVLYQWYQGHKDAFLEQAKQSLDRLGTTPRASNGGAAAGAAAERGPVDLRGNQAVARAIERAVQIIAASSDVESQTAVAAAAAARAGTGGRGSGGGGGAAVAFAGGAAAATAVANAIIKAARAAPQAMAAMPVPHRRDSVAG